MGRCTIPYRDRTVRPIAYYTNPEMPPEFQDHVEIEGAGGVRTYRFPTQAEATARRGLEPALIVVLVVVRPF